MRTGSRARALDLEERIALRALGNCVDEPRYYPLSDISSFVQEVVMALAQDMLGDIDPIDEIEAIMFTTGKAQSLALNHYRVKLQNTLRITHNLLCEVSLVNFRQDQRISIEWTPPGGGLRRMERFALDRIHLVVERLMSISHGEKTQVSMGMSFTPGKSLWGEK